MAFLVFSPQIFYPFLTKDSYQGINAGDHGTDELNYLARGKEIMEGHGLGNIVLREGKDGYNIPLTYVEYAFIWPLKLLHLENKVNVVTVFRVFGFVGVFFLIMLIYFFVLELSPNKLLASATALFFVGGYTLVRLYPAPHLIGATGGDAINFNIYSRPVVPLYAMFCLFLYLNFLIKSLKSEKTLYVICSGISLGALFYVYFYGWTFAYALTFALFCIYLLKKDFARAKKIAVVGFLGLLIGSYVLSQVFLISRSEMGKQILFFGGNVSDSAFVFSKIAFIPLLLFLIFWHKNRKSDNWPILLALVSANWIVLNQQVITGRSVQSLHYFWHFVIPISIFVGIYTVWSFISNNKYQKIFLIILIILAYANIMFQQYQSLKALMPFKQYAQNYRPIIDYLNKDANPGVVLASDDFYRPLLLVYTSDDLFWSAFAIPFNTPQKRFKDALFVYLYLNKESRNNFSGYINMEMKRPLEQFDTPYRVLYYDIERYKSGLETGDYLHKLLTNDPSVASLRKRILTPLALEYEQIAGRQNGIKDILKEAGVNYILWDKNRNPEWDLFVLSGLKEIVSSNNIYLYRINYNNE